MKLLPGAADSVPAAAGMEMDRNNNSPQLPGMI